MKNFKEIVCDILQEDLMRRRQTDPRTGKSTSVPNTTANKVPIARVGKEGTLYYRSEKQKDERTLSAPISKFIQADIRKFKDEYSKTEDGISFFDKLRFESNYRQSRNKEKELKSVSKPNPRFNQPAQIARANDILLKRYYKSERFKKLKEEMMKKMEETLNQILSYKEKTKESRMMTKTMANNQASQYLDFIREYGSTADKTKAQDFLDKMREGEEELSIENKVKFIRSNLNSSIDNSVKIFFGEI